MNHPALSVTDVSKHFAEVLAVDDVSIDVADAELLALVGPSGCGKSTLLRMIAGLIPIESGRIELGGTVADDGRRSLPPEQRHVGLVFQEHALFPHLSVERNIAFGVRTTNVERASRVAEMLELVGLGSHAKRY
ncbi:MAG: ABC transporter ATP-binding protein, partial [Ilumatobacter sp.]